MIGYVLAGAVLIAFVAYQLSTSARRRRSEAPYSPAPDGVDAISVSSADDDSEGHHHHHGGHGHHQGDDQTGDLGGHHGGDFGGHHGGDPGGTDFGGHH